MAAPATGRSRMTASVTFQDVAVYFQEEEWERLKERQKQLYRMVMEEIHEALCSLGYSIRNPDVLIRIKSEPGPDTYEHQVVKTEESKSAERVAGWSDILFHLKEENECYNKSGFGGLNLGLERESLSGDEDEVNPDLLFRIKEEEEPCPVYPEEEEGVTADSTHYSADSPELVIIVKKEPCDLEINNSDAIDIPYHAADDDGFAREAKNVQASQVHVKDITHVESATGTGHGQQKMGLSEERHAAKETPDNHVKPSCCSYVDSKNKTEPLLTEGAQLGDLPVDWSECENVLASRARARQDQGNCYSDSVYKCQECDKTFSKNSNLLRHQRIHTGERPYECKECDKNFLLKASLIQHIRIHTGEKPYKCTECDKSFRLNSTLVYHITTHRDEKLFKCPQCEKSFPLKSMLVNHLRVHTGERPFKCTQCEKSFTLKSTLVNHLRVHTGERPFKCTGCVKCFINLKNLQKHQRIHTGERPYTCPLCPKSFTNVSNQRKHQKTHTREKPFSSP